MLANDLLSTKGKRAKSIWPECSSLFPNACFNQRVARSPPLIKTISFNPKSWLLTNKWAVCIWLKMLNMMWLLICCLLLHIVWTSCTHIKDIDLIFIAQRVRFWCSWWKTVCGGSLQYTETAKRTCSSSSTVITSLSATSSFTITLLLSLYLKQIHQHKSPENVSTESTSEQRRSILQKNKLYTVYQVLATHRIN